MGDQSHYPLPPLSLSSPSTALTTPCFWVICGLMFCMLQSLTGCGHFWPTEHSRLPTVTLRQLSVSVPQWSVLGPVLYLLCTAESDLVVSRQSPNLHHADDTQVYVNISARHTEAAVECLAACLVDIEICLAQPHQTRVMWLGSNSACWPKSKSKKCQSTRINVSETARDSRHWQSAVADVCKVAAVCRSDNITSYGKVMAAPTAQHESIPGQSWCQGRINHLVGPTHSTTPGPHWKTRRRRGREGWEGCPLPNQIGVWGALYTLLSGKNTSLSIRISEISRRPL